jgi:Uma2 family endonuclease
LPDVLVICGKPTKKYLDFTPALVDEILSPSTAFRDRHTKYEIYEQQGVNYYLILDTDKNEVEIFELINGNINCVRLINQHSSLNLKKKDAQLI